MTMAQRIGYFFSLGPIVIMVLALIMGLAPLHDVVTNQPADVLAEAFGFARTIFMVTVIVLALFAAGKVKRIRSSLRRTSGVARDPRRGQMLGI